MAEAFHLVYITRWLQFFRALRLSVASTSFSNTFLEVLPPAFAYSKTRVPP